MNFKPTENVKKELNFDLLNEMIATLSDFHGLFSPP